MGHQEHKHHAPKQVTCMVITVSDTRTEETDTSGKYIVELLQKNGHKILHKTIVPDEPEAIQALLQKRKEPQAASCLDLAGDLVGRVAGPSDLSSNSAYLEGFGE